VSAGRQREAVTGSPIFVRVLIVHNEYQRPGGEDEVAAREADLLRSFGHQVTVYRRTNSEIGELGRLQKATLPIRTLWARDSYRDITNLIRDARPHLAHFHNTFLMVSPAAYYACRRSGIPVVQTLHNPRLLCPAATSWRNGKLCTLCDGHTMKWPGIFRACYRQSHAQTAAVAAMIAGHHLAGTWHNLVDRYLVTTEYYRRRFIEAGFASGTIALKPHFVADDPGARQDGPGEYALYIGRLDPEKGAETLLHAWKRLVEVPLVIRGEGSLMSTFQEAIRRGEVRSAILSPRLSRADLWSLIKGARFLVWPSEGAYETFGLVAIEAFSCSVPVLTSGEAVNAEIVDNGQTGIHFHSGNATDLADKVLWAWKHPAELAEMGRAARRVFTEEYSAGKNHEMLMDIYNRILRERSVEVAPERSPI
jgi:glycosyltransferase involved in cell wall biosynthesis